MAELQDANSNPWYVLMTLYGAQEGYGVDSALHDQNRGVWNAWSCQGLDYDAAAEVAAQARVDVSETRGWAEIADKVKRKHRAEMKKRNKDVADYTYPGFPGFEKLIGCSEIQFFNTAVMKNCIFTQTTHFRTATFMQDIDFECAVFTREVDFSGAKFMKDAAFNSVKFTELTQFISTIFEQTAYFRDSVFSKDANFFSIKVSGIAYFSFASFAQLADFSRAMFNGPAKFVRTKFGVKGADVISIPIFKDTTFARSVSFRDAVFVSHYHVLEGTEFRETVVATAKDEHWPDRGLVLLGEGAKGAGKVPTKEVAKESCASLRHALAKQGMPEEEHFFFRREMEFSRQVELGDRNKRWPYFRSWFCFSAWPYWIFKVLSGYGQSIGRPIEWLCGVFGLGIGLFGAHLNSAASLPSAIGEGAALSFSNLLPLFGFGRLYFDGDYMTELPTVLQVWSGAQTVFALPLLFFLGLALRKRFRLR